MIGPLANLLALRVDLSGNPSFRRLAVEVDGLLAEARAHGSLPFEKLLEALPVQRDLSLAPLTQVGFTCSRRLLGPAPRAGGPDEVPRQGPRQGVEAPVEATIEAMQILRRGTRFDLTLAVAETPGHLQATLEYTPDLFDAQRIQRMADAYLTLLVGAAADPDGSLSELPVLPPSERRQVLESWNDTAANYPRDECMHHLFELQALKTPQALALSYAGEKLTFAELNRRANQFAHYLRALGVGPEVLVAICVERSIDMVVSLLGILKAGGAYVPLDPSYPRSRLAFILENSGARLLLTRTALVDSLPTQNLQVLCLEQIQPAVAQASPENPPHTTIAENLACVLYTSGSSGIPKGVSSPHRGVINRFHWMWRTYPFTSTDVFCQKTALNFVDSIWDIFCPLLRGVPVVILPDEAVKDAALAVKTLSEEKISHIVLVPSLLRALLDTGMDLREVLPDLKYCITSGEAISLELYRRFRDALPRAVLLNLYGTSEVADATWYDSAWERPFLRVPIGRPIANVQIYLLDAHLQPVPVGVAGELYVGGDGLARGYLNRPDLTAEKLVPDPFSGIAGARLYRTGDLACWLPDGNLDYLGRMDFQVKIRGLRVELSEIEATLRQHPAVTAVVAVAREDLPGEKYLAAYLVAQADEQLSASELRLFLAERLPGYMIPAAFVFLENMPLTPNGKVDRRALPSPAALRPDLREGFVAPRSRTEIALAEIWCEILRLERVGVQDNFFELGGHSLLAMRLASRIQQRLHVNLPLRVFFESPVIADLALVIEDLSKQAWGAEAQPQRLGRTQAPLSFAQQSLWFIDRLAPGSTAYHIPSALRIQGRLDPGVLERCLNEIIRRHEALRTTFAEQQGLPVQRIAPELKFNLPWVDLSPLPQAERLSAAQNWMLADTGRPFDLSGGSPLFRAALLRIAPDEHILYVNLHHIISDGWSGEVFHQEWTELYQAFCNGQASPLPELPLQYADFSTWQHARLQGPVLDELLAYWKAHLEGVPPVLELPADRPRPAAQSFRGATLAVPIPAELVAAIKSIAQQEESTLFMLLLAAFDVLLFRHTAQADFAVGVPVANRSFPGLEGLIGFFVNTLALRADLSGNPTFRQLLRRVRETALGAFVHQELPLNRLIEELHLRRDLSYNPLFQVMFALQNVPNQDHKLPGLSLSPLKIDIQTAMFDLSLSIEENGPELTAEFEYNRDLFDAGRIQRLGAAFLTLLRGIAAHPDQKLSDLPIIPAVELQRVLNTWNDTRSAYPLEQSVHQLFEQQAARTPEALAVVMENQGEAPFLSGVTYQELNARANQLARHLVTLGIAPGDRVGIYLERSIPLITALLGVLKAGGTYLPLDPAYPRERLAFMLQDSAARLVLTQPELKAELQASVVLHPTPSHSRDEAGGAQASSTHPPTPATALRQREARGGGDLLMSFFGGMPPKKDENLLPFLPESGGRGQGDGGGPPFNPDRGSIRPEGWENLKILCLDAGDPSLNGYSPDNLPARARPLDPAYIIYTSGSTGLPKGVLVTRRGLTNVICGEVELFKLQPGDRLLQFASISFDTAAEEIFTTLTSGATLVLRGEEMIASPARFWETCRALGITVLDFPTAYWHELVAHFPQPPFSLPPALRSVIIGGEEALPQHLRTWHQVVGERVSLLNGYGPTEVSIVATFSDLTHPAAAEATPALSQLRSVSIGSPLPNVQAYVLDAHLQPLPVGGAGELYIGGAGLALGYLNRPDLTAERFIPNPFSAAPGERLYRTGDRACWNDRGELDYLGRGDRQVKLRGFRIELGEIETTLAQHPGVQDAVVLLRQDLPEKVGDLGGDKRLVAYVVGRPDQPPNATELRAFLKERLPGYMLPAAYLFLDRLPVGATGKVDHQALPAPTTDGGLPSLQPGEDFSAPRNPTEAALAQMWTEVLNLERVGTQDNFFDLGGHSLLATQVIARVQQLFQLEIPLRSLFEAPTVAEFARKVDGMLLTARLAPGASEDPQAGSTAEERETFEL